MTIVTSRCGRRPMLARLHPGFCQTGCKPCCSRRPLVSLIALIRRGFTFRTPPK